MRHRKMTKAIYNEFFDYYSQGMTLKEILIKFEDLSKANLLKIKDTYFRKYTRDVGLFRENVVYYNIVEAEIAKDCLDHLIKKHSENTYLVNNLKSKTFKDYLGEKTLFVYDFTEKDSNYTELIYILDDLFRPVYNRKIRILGIWNEVQFTSSYSPEDLHYRLEKDKYDEKLSVKGLLWRVNYVVFHYKLEVSGKVVYREYKVHVDSYNTYDELKEQAIANDPEYAAYILKI